MKKSRTDSIKATHKSDIEQKFAAETGIKILEARQAWRGLLIPMFGASVFAASTLVNVIRTYRQYGWPEGAFSPADKVLMALPVVILGMTIFYQAEEAELKDIKDSRPEPLGA